MRFRVVCEQEAAVAVEAAAAHARHVSLLAAKPWREWVEAGHAGSQRAERAAAWAAERAQRVAVGEWTFSRSDLLRAELAALIAERGWQQRRWKPLPAEASASGRRWGVTTRSYGAAVHFDVEDRQAELIRRVAYWTSEKATRHLREFVDRHGRGPAAVADLPPAAQGLGLLVSLMRLPSDEQLSERQRWQRQVVTTGDILREVIYRAGQGYTPPPPSHH